MLGWSQVVVAGGMENMDQAPYLVGGGRWGYRMGDAQIYDSMLRDGLNDAFSDQHSGWVTEDPAVEGAPWPMGIPSELPAPSWRHG